MKVEELEKGFFGVFGRDGKPRIIRAPGRVNLIGEHTDYNDGFVLPIAIDRDIWMAARARSDDKVNLHDLRLNLFSSFSLSDIKRSEMEEEIWANYPKGVMHFLQEEGYRLKGMDIALYGDVPQEAGLSSSAAFEMVTAMTCQVINELDIDPIDMIKLCQRAENEFVGVNCGIMDQFISRLGRKDSALLLDCRDLTYEHVPLDLFKIIICDTRVKRGLVSSKYNTRREECNTATKLLSQHYLGVKALRDISPPQFEEAKDNLPEIVRKRCKHVVYENERTLKAVECLKKGDMEELGKAMSESHNSLRDDYEVSCPELDVMVEIASQVEGVIGARMTGAGFGGCTINLVEENRFEELIAAIEREYPQRTKLEPKIYICRAVNGAEEVRGK